MTRLRCIVVVGASAAGLAAAETLRSEGYDGRLVIVGEEDERPYDRPPLSKQILSGAWEPSRSALRSDEELSKLRAEWRLGHVVTGLDVGRRTLTLQTGADIDFDGLIIATGVKPRKLQMQPTLKGVHELRTLQDAHTLRAALAGRPRVLVIGAGVLGTELAATARTLSHDVTLVGHHRYPLRQFGSAIGMKLADLHKLMGVNLQLGASVKVVVGSCGKVNSVGLSNGNVCAAELVVAAIGSIPATGWLEGSGLKIGDGIECDDFCAAAPRIFAAGDVASWWHQGYSRRMRIEHRMNAVEQGAVAARNLLGAGQPFRPVPFVWSHQYNVKLQAYGIFPPDGSFTIENTDVKGGFISSCRQNGRLVGAVGWNSVRELRIRRQFIADEMFAAA